MQPLLDGNRERFNSAIRNHIRGRSRVTREAACRGHRESFAGGGRVLGRIGNWARFFSSFLGAVPVRGGEPSAENEQAIPAENFPRSTPNRILLTLLPAVTQPNNPVFRGFKHTGDGDEKGSGGSEVNSRMRVSTMAKLSLPLTPGDSRPRCFASTFFPLPTDSP
jgi:hypothetical protein